MYRIEEKSVGDEKKLNLHKQHPESEKQVFLIKQKTETTFIWPISNIHTVLKHHSSCVDSSRQFREHLKY